MKMSTGRRPMASLRSSLACPPAEDLHTSQGDISNNAHRKDVKLGTLVRGT